MKGVGIHARFLLAAFFLIAAVTFTLDIIVVHITKQFMYKRFTDRIGFLSKYLALNSEVGVLINDRAGLTLLSQNLLEEEDVYRVVIVDQHRKPIVDIEIDSPPQLLELSSPIYFKKNVDENLLFATESGDETDVMEGENRISEDIIGYVQIYYSTRGIEKFLSKITQQFVWFSVGLAIVGGGAFYLISRSVGKELMHLAITARQIGRGDRELRAQLGKLPETRYLAEAFNAMLDSLSKSQKALDKVNREMIKQKALAEVGKFSLMIAHEIKNPLGIIKGSLDILKKNTDEANRNLMIHYIEDEISRLNRLVENFLKFARPMNPKFMLLELNSMLKDVVDKFEVQYNALPNVIQNRISKDTTMVYADRDLLTRALSNIIENSFDAIDSQGKISISSYSEADTWVVVVEDNGNGIDPNIVEKIFDPFYTTRTKGTGLGLAFALQAIKAHKGKINVKPSNTKGTIFSIELPIDKTN